MTLEVRRVVTTHDQAGKAVVAIDALADNPTSRRSGHQSQLIWTTDGTPADISGSDDCGARQLGRPPPPGGTIFRILELQPGVASEMHNTDTIDYVVVMSGEVEMELDRTTITLKAGDVLVQQGTNHCWAVRGPEPCRLAAILIDARPPPRKA